MTKIPTVLKAKAANPKLVSWSTSSSYLCFGH